MIDMVTRGRRAMAGAGLVTAVALLAAACTGAGTGRVAGTTAAPPSAEASPVASVAAPASAAPSEGTAAGGGVYEVTTGTSAATGAFLAGEDGKTLYVYTKDSPGKSVCNGSCAAAWPPFVLGPGETVKAGPGVTGTLATIKRDDGSMQVTYKDAPLYYFASDQKAGDVTGQGVGGVWYVAAP